MNSSNSSFLIPANDAQSGLISDYAMDLVEAYFQSLFITILSIIGIVTNALNTVVFLKQGFQEGSTVSFLVLSLADFGNVSFTFGVSVVYILHSLKADTPVDPLIIYYVFLGWPRTMFSDLVVITTVFVSVERCLCVTLPFKFKTLLTPKKTAIILVILWTAVISVFVPIYATHGMTSQTNPDTNVTALAVYFSKGRDTIEGFLLISNTIVLNTSAEGIVMISSLAMIGALRQSMKFRESTAQGGDDIRTAAEATPKPKLASTKENSLIKMVLAISVVFVICNVPFVLFAYARLLIPELNVNQRYNNMFFTTYSVVTSCSVINGMVNFFVYYKHSSKFRKTFHSICARQRARKS